ncbi:MAG TPA: 4-hydroxy-tetrahydrodipicolinate reductase [Chloroflexota bacterium]|nr:4-hydroxy-tetrahydrodipicolinate reductase [Chloroflexota bacterium]
MSMIRVAVAGALGRMGTEVIRAVSEAEDTDFAGGIDVRAGDRVFADLGQAIAQTKPQVLVDFTTADAAFGNAMTSLQHGVRPVIGTTGLSPEQVAQIESRAAETKTGAFLAPNFALGAVLMMHFARIGARYFDSAEVIDLHHDQKIDSPSGTGLKTAEEMAKARGKPFGMNVPEKEPLPGARGAEWQGIRLHSVRLPGLVAHHEVIFGAQGQILTIRHDSTDRTSFMPGVLIAIREVVKLNRLVVGLDKLLHLE